MKLKRLSILLVAAAALVASGCGLKSSNELDATITPTPVVTVAPTVAPPSPTPVPVATPTPTPAPKYIGTKEEGAVVIPVKNETTKVLTDLYIAPSGTAMESNMWGPNLVNEKFAANEVGELYYDSALLDEEGKVNIKVRYEDGTILLLDRVALKDMKNMFLYINDNDGDIYVRYDSISEGEVHDTWLDWHDLEEAEESEEYVEDVVDTTGSTYDNNQYNTYVPYTAYTPYTPYVPADTPTYDAGQYTPPAYDYSYVVPNDGGAVAVVE